MAWPITELSMTCRRSGVEHTVSIGLPVRYRSLDEAPLLLCLDGPWVFGTTLDASRIMSMSGEAPEAIVVGLSFSERSMAEYLRHRARWFTPTPWVPPPITGVKGITAQECGRADVMVDFVRDQLLPEVERAHTGGCRVSQRWLIGHSFSALFGLRTLLTEPAIFDKWLLASPSIWWDDRAVLRLEADHAARSTDLVARVFTSYGELEAVDQPEPDFAMGANVETLVATLRSRGYPGLDLTHGVLVGDGHASSIGAAVSKGLRALQ